MVYDIATVLPDVGIYIFSSMRISSFASIVLVLFGFSMGSLRVLDEREQQPDAHRPKSTSAISFSKEIVSQYKITLS